MQPPTILIVRRLGIFIFNWRLKSEVTFLAINYLIDNYVTIFHSHEINPVYPAGGCGYLVCN